MEILVRDRNKALQELRKIILHVTGAMLHPRSASALVPITPRHVVRRALEPHPPEWPMRAALAGTPTAIAIVRRIVVDRSRPRPPLARWQRRPPRPRHTVLPSRRGVVLRHRPTPLGWRLRRPRSRLLLRLLRHYLTFRHR